MSNSEQYILHVGSKKYSSWSLRVWLLMKVKKIPFYENRIPFISLQNKRGFNVETKKNISIISKTKRVPALSSQKLSISESLPILEYLNELYPEKELWPSSLQNRTMARMISGVLYSGFHKTKLLLPFVGDGRRKTNLTMANVALQGELNVLLNILPPMESISKNKYLFGSFSIADAMITPFVMRYYSYGVKVPKFLESYIENVMSMPEVQSWIKVAQEEKEMIKEIEEIFEKFPDSASVEYKL